MSGTGRRFGGVSGGLFGGSSGGLFGGLFGGERRVWLVAGLAAIPMVALIAVWCLVPRDYYTGTDSVNFYTLTAPVPAGSEVCQAGLNLPAGTGRVQLELGTGGIPRPALTLLLRTPRGTITSRLPPGSRPFAISRVAFPIPRTPGSQESVPMTLCVRAAGVVGWGITPATEAILPGLTVGGASTNERLAVWYLPPAGVRRSLASETGRVLHRATLFSAGFVRPWLLAVILFGVLPVLALLAVALLALAAGGRGRRLALAVYLLAFVNAAAWAVINPPFQAPDEVDHYAYVQSIAERGHSPTPYPQARLGRWSTAENSTLEASAMITDHIFDDTRAPWLQADVRRARALFARTGDDRSDGGGYEGASGYGPVYYLALVPGYAVAAHASTATQLTWMRIVSAAIGALAALFALLLVRELAPRRPWLGVLAGLLVAFQPMYSFLSGTVNNDVGVDAGAAAVAYLLVRALRRGLDRRTGVALGAVLGILPVVKGSGFDFFPITALVVLLLLWRARAAGTLRERGFVLGLVTLVGTGAVALGIAEGLVSVLRPGPPFPGATLTVATAGGTISTALHHPGSYLTYLWDVFFPPVGPMHQHFPPNLYPADEIFVRSGFGAFGWNVVRFPAWVYSVIGWTVVAAGIMGLVAAWRERGFVRGRWAEVALLIVIPIVVIAAVEAVFYTPARRYVITEFGRYEMPALAAYVALVIGALHAFGRRWVPVLGTVLLVAMLALGYASQLLVLTHYYA